MGGHCIAWARQAKSLEGVSILVRSSLFLVFLVKLDLGHILSVVTVLLDQHQYIYTLLTILPFASDRAIPPPNNS
jgi:hypothetical protein